MNEKKYSEIDIPLGNKSEKEILDEMKKKARAYDGTLPYDPLANGDAYNSNSLMSGLLNAMGYDGVSLVNSLPGVQPGGSKPVPTNKFE